MKIVIKVGTGVLTRENGTLDGSSIVHLVSALAGLMQQGHQVVLVSSRRCRGRRVRPGSSVLSSGTVLETGVRGRGADAADAGV